MKVKDRYWEVENSIRFANPEKATRPLLCGPKVSEDGVRIRLWLRNLAEGTGAGGAIVLLSRHEAAVMANAINTRSNWIGEKTSDMPRIGVSVTETSTIIRFMECGGAGHIALLQNRYVLRASCNLWGCHSYRHALNAYAKVISSARISACRIKIKTRRECSKSISA